jgi:hypothetical protein
LQKWVILRVSRRRTWIRIQLLENSGSGKHEYGSATPARTVPGGVVCAGKETVQKLQTPFPVQQLEVPKMQRNDRVLLRSDMDINTKPQRFKSKKESTSDKKNST